MSDAQILDTMAETGIWDTNADGRILDMAKAGIWANV